MTLKIGLIGDYDESVIAHRAIPLAIHLSAELLNLEFEHEWINTNKITIDILQTLDAIWCVPASPYLNRKNVLMAIQYAREKPISFLGTCGGYQHAVLEYARNELSYPEADNSEENPDADMPLITNLVCKLVEKSDSIILQANSKVGQIYNSNNIEEDYHCSFGVNSSYLAIFDQSAMKFVGHDDLGDPRVMELSDHPFFIGTAYQPERSANKSDVHPLITAFLKSITSSRKTT